MSAAQQSRPLDGRTRLGNEYRQLIVQERLFREVNEQICTVAKRFGITRELDLLCECAGAGCSERLVVPIEEYERIRRVPTWFLVTAGHQASASERVVEEASGFSVVEKTGDGAAIATRTNPRGSAQIQAP